jgi:hypothetical protein
MKDKFCTNIPKNSLYIYSKKSNQINKITNNKKHEKLPKISEKIYKDIYP